MANKDDYYELYASTAAAGRIWNTLPDSFVSYVQHHPSNRSDINWKLFRSNATSVVGIFAARLSLGYL